MRGRVLVALVLLTGPAIAPSVLGTSNPGADDRLLVTLDTWPPTAAVLDAIDRSDGHVEDRFPASRALLVQAPASTAGELAERSGVADVTPETALTPNLDSSKVAVDLPSRLHAADLTGSNVTVALVNGGVDQDHPGLRDRVVQELAVTPDGIEANASGSSYHGTHVAGVLAGTGDQAGPDRGDVSGVAPGADVVSLDISADFTTSNALRAFEWIEENHAEHDIRVVLSSWGRLRDPAHYQPDDPIIRASDALVHEGLVVVFSAGNGGPTESAMSIEATNPNVISVGATTDAGRVESYSSRGPVLDGDGVADWTKPDLVAPGTRILSARASGSGPGTNYLYMNGTSMAAPHVAGAAALILSQRPELTPPEVKDALVGTATDVGPPGVDDASGAGLLDVDDALASLDALPGPQRSTITGQGDASLPTERRTGAGPLADAGGSRPADVAADPQPTDVDADTRSSTPLVGPESPRILDRVPNHVAFATVAAYLLGGLLVGLALVVSRSRHAGPHPDLGPAPAVAIAAERDTVASEDAVHRRGRTLGTPVADLDREEGR